MILSCSNFVAVLVLIALMYNYLPKTRKKLSNQCVIVITGGIQGIGKLLAQNFAQFHKDQISLVLIDIREDLAPDAISSIKKQTGIDSIDYYNTDISDVQQLEKTWKQILDKHKKVNILVNNAARALGRNFSDLSLEQFKKTIDINFISIVQLTKLFVSQPQLIASQRYGEFHLTNINSIGGTISLSKWTDYGSSKFALRGFTQGLRYELKEELPNVVMTNIYPYYINTGLFEGFKPLLEKIIPTIDQHYCAKRIYDVIMEEQEEVHIWWYLHYMRLLIELLPLKVSTYINYHLVCKGMKGFVGREQKTAQNQ